MSIDFISVVIPTWKNYEQLMALLDSLIPQLDCFRNKEVIIIDDTPPLEQVEIKLARDYVRLFKNIENLGYAASLNAGLSLISLESKAVFILNDDVILGAGCVNKLVFALQDAQVDAAAPRLLFPNGIVQPSIRKLPTVKSMIFDFFPILNKIYDYRCTDMNYGSFALVEQPMFSAVMVKRSALDSVGGLDEQFLMYFNDVDWCKRFIDSGAKIGYFPEAYAVHYHGVSGKKLGFRKELLWIQGFYRYFAKYSCSSRIKRAGLLFFSSFVFIFKVLRRPFVK